MEHGLGKRVLMDVLQSWKRTAQERAATMNEAMREAGLVATVKVGEKNGEPSLFYSAFDQRDLDLAAEFWEELDKVLLIGEFNAEAIAIEQKIKRFRTELAKTAEG